MMWIVELVREFVGVDLLESAKVALLGDVSLLCALVTGVTRLWAYYREWPEKWQERAHGAFLAFAVLAVIHVGQFTYKRLTVDPRAISADKVDAFKTALGPYDGRQTVTVFCFPSDRSSCDLAAKYRDWFADHWNLAAPQLEPSGNYPADLYNRVWVYTKFEYDRPSGAIRLHSALDRAGMNPGYRVNSSMDQYNFGFAVGRSH